MKDYESSRPTYASYLRRLARQGKVFSQVVDYDEKGRPIVASVALIKIVTNPEFWKNAPPSIFQPFRQCVECKAWFPPGHGLQWVCDECKKSREKARKREWWRKKRGTRREN